MLFFIITNFFFSSNSFHNIPYPVWDIFLFPKVILVFIFGMNEESQYFGLYTKKLYGDGVTFSKWAL
jgi:hypothetical protein